MNTDKSGGAAFPCPASKCENARSDGYNGTDGQEGMTLRQYAAIKLRVPDSGIDWLDEMIVKSNRDDFAAKAINGILSDDCDFVLKDGETYQSRIAELSYKYADAMIEERKKQYE